MTLSLSLIHIFQQKPKRISYAVRSDIRKLDLRIRQMEFLQKEGINTREELAAYRKPLEEQVLSLMKERRTLYRKKPGSIDVYKRQSYQMGKPR